MIEILSLMVQAGILGAAVIALNSISVSKRINEENSSRESIKYSSELVNLFLSKIIGDSNKLDKYVTAKDPNAYRSFKFSLLEHKVKDFTWEEFLSIKNDIVAVHRILKEREKFDNEYEYIELALVVMNQLEAFSAPFIAGVAEEDVAFRAVGQSFCGIVEDLYFDYVRPRSKSRKNFDYFDNTIKLYFVWKQKFTKHKLSSQKDIIEAKLTEISNR